MEDEIKYAEGGVCYEIVITKHSSRPIRKRSSQYISVDKRSGEEDSSGYVYGEWYDTTERNSVQIFQQTIDEEGFNFPAIVKAVNKL